MKVIPKSMVFEAVQYSGNPESFLSILKRSGLDSSYSDKLEGGILKICNAFGEWEIKSNEWNVKQGMWVVIDSNGYIDAVTSSLNKCYKIDETLDLGIHL